MAVQSRSDFRKLYADRLAYIRELIGPDKWPEVDKQWEQFFRVEPSSRMREEFLMYGGFGSFRTMGENENVTYDNMVQGPQKTLTHVLYGLGFKVGYLARKHDLDGIIKRNAPELGRAMRNSIQVLAASFYNDSFAGSLTADGQYYFDTDHTYLRGGGTYANRPSTSATTLGHSALETGLITFDKQKDLMGNPQPVQAETLLIPPDLQPMAHELLRSQMRHDTTTHANSWLTGKLKPVSWPYLTSTTAWFILGPKSQRQVYWLWNIKPETTHGYDFDSEAAKTKTLFACSFGAVDPRASYASPGA